MAYSCSDLPWIILSETLVVCPTSRGRWGVPCVFNTTKESTNPVKNWPISWEPNFIPCFCISLSAGNRVVYLRISVDDWQATVRRARVLAAFRISKFIHLIPPVDRDQMWPVKLRLLNFAITLRLHSTALMNQNIPNRLSLSTLKIGCLSLFHDVA